MCTFWFFSVGLVPFAYHSEIPTNEMQTSVRLKAWGWRRLECFCLGRVSSPNFQKIHLMSTGYFQSSKYIADLQIDKAGINLQNWELRVGLPLQKLPCLHFKQTENWSWYTFTLLQKNAEPSAHHTNSNTKRNLPTLAKACLPDTCGKVHHKRCLYDPHSGCHVGSRLWAWALWELRIPVLPRWSTHMQSLGLGKTPGRTGPNWSWSSPYQGSRNAQ